MDNIIKQVQEMIPESYLVGGSVRDSIIGKSCNDFDFATSLNANEIEEAVRKARRRPYLIGKRFGTVGCKIDRKFVEITTFRSEKYIEGNRKPEVEFINSLEVDLSRRDFTINAMAIDKKLIDPFGGRLDILQKKIKCVGFAKQRFKEDPLRILRAARFASQLGFEIDQLTEAKMKRMAYSILTVSKERWMMELDKILLSDKPSVGLNYLIKNRLFNFIIPELSLQLDFDQVSPYHTLSLWEHTVKVVDLCNNDINLRWAALLHDIAKPFVKTSRKQGGFNYIDHEKLGAEMVEKIALYLKWSRKRRERVCNLVKNHLQNESPLKKFDNLAK